MPPLFILPVAVLLLKDFCNPFKGSTFRYTLPFFPCPTADYASLMTHYSDKKKMESFSAKEFPLNRESYELLEEVGQGVSAKVHRALCIPLNKVVAIKVMDLERGSSVLDAARREVHTMSLVNHPNLLNAYCSFTAGRKLWIVLPYMGGGSCLHIMKSAYPDGFEEPVIATMLHETLKALAYLHAQGNIHRDVKAGNMLIDSKGTVKLGDFGVSASMFDSGQRQITRNTFVGTPCWMAPEVMQQLHGYDFKADIWSFGITALELAHGHAPFSKYPPMKVLLMTLQNAPPGLDYERDKKFSKSFKEIVAACLVKDPAMRPTSEKLLSHRFFKQSRLSGFLAQTILSQLPPLGDRYRVLKEREAELFLQKNTMYEDREQLSQQEYMRGISAWNFDVEDLRRQAALLQDCDGISNSENNCLSRKQADSDTSSVCNSNSSKSTPSQEDGSRGIQSVEKSPTSYITPHALDDHLDAHLRCTSAGYSKQNNQSSVEDALEAFRSINGKGMHRFDSDNGSQNGHANANCGASTNYANTTTTSIVPSLQCILQQNNLIKEHLLRTIKSVDSCTEGKRVSKAQHLQMFSAYAKEMELRSQIINMKQRIGKLVEELREQKMKNAELERKLTASLNKE